MEGKNRTSTTFRKYEPPSGNLTQHQFEAGSVKGLEASGLDPAKRQTGGF